MNRNEAILDAANQLTAMARQGNPAPGCENAKNGVAGVQLADRTLYVTGEIPVGGGSKEFFKDITKKAVGVTNFNRNELNSLQNARIDAVTLEYGTLPDSNTDAFEIAVKKVNFKTAAIDAILNSEFKFKCNGKLLIEDTGYELHNVNSGNTRNDDYKEVGHRPWIEPLKPCEFEVEVPSGVTLTPSTRHFVRLTFRVAKTGERI